MTTPALYQEMVLDHHRAPRNFGSLDGYTHSADGANPLCGDSLRAEVVVVAGRITQLRFRGEACAIATATASMLSELVQGLDAAALAELQARFARAIGGAAPEDPGLAALNALRELARYPMRRKCALLPFATLHAALAGEQTTTTDNASV